MLLFLFGCQTSPSVSTHSGVQESISDINETTFSSSSFRVGILLPLTGDAEKYGQGLKNAALMAYEDMNNPNLTLQFYDTLSSPEGARIAAENAMNQKVRMIIGPLSSTDVRAISDQTISRGIPVIAFSTDSGVLQQEIYTLGLLVQEQVNRIMAYAAKKGRRNFALLLPDNSTGITVAKAAVNSSIRNDVRIVRIAFYPANTTDFSDIVRDLTGYKGDIRDKNNKNRNEVDFDAVLIPESGAKLKSAVAMFGYYDVFSPEVKFLGTSVWENTALNRESTMQGSWYPALSRNHSAYFNKKFNALFGSYPNSLFTFAYDAVALASALAKQRPANINAAITTPDGFAGISGVFRILPNGRNEHSLDIIEITKSGDVVVDLAPKRFSTAPSIVNIDNAADSYDAYPPLIFGKDVPTAQNQIFGRIPGRESQREENTMNSFSF